MDTGNEENTQDNQEQSGSAQSGGSGGENSSGSMGGQSGNSNGGGNSGGGGSSSGSDMIPYNRPQSEYPQEVIEKFNNGRRYSGRARGIDGSRQSLGESSRAMRAFNSDSRKRNSEENSSTENSGQTSVYIVPTSVETKENMCNCNSGIVPVPVAGFGYGGYGAGVPAVAPAVGGIGTEYYAHQAALMASENACKAAENVKDSESNIKDAIQVQTNLLSLNNTGLLQKVCDAEKAAIENRGILLAGIKDSQNILQAQLAECCCDMKVMNMELKTFITDKFCDLERRGLEDEIQELRDAKTDNVNSGILSTLSAILAKIK